MASLAHVYNLPVVVVIVQNMHNIIIKVLVKVTATVINIKKIIMMIILVTIKITCLLMLTINFHHRHCFVYTIYNYLPLFSIIYNEYYYVEKIILHFRQRRTISCM